MELLSQIFSNELLTQLSLFASTLFLEDAATLTGGTLVATGVIDFAPVLTALFLGILVGDLGLFLLGKNKFTRNYVRNRVSDEAIQKAEDFFEQNATWSLFSARFVPGLRLPFYFSAGAFGVSVWRFLFVAVGASAIWTTTALYLIVQFGALAAHYIESGQQALLLLAAVALLLYFISSRLFARA